MLHVKNVQFIRNKIVNAKKVLMSSLPPLSVFHNSDKGAKSMFKNMFDSKVLTQKGLINVTFKKIKQSPLAKLAERVLLNLNIMGSNPVQVETR